VRSALLMRADRHALVRDLPALLAVPGGRVAVLAGSVEASWLLQRGTAPGRLLTVPDAQAGAAAVEAGQAEALLLSLPSLTVLASRRPEGWRLLPLRPVADQSPPTGWVAFQFPPGQVGLQAAWDAAQAGLSGTAAYGDWLRRHSLGAEDLPPPPPGATA
jgi:ABC-type amino acid transport substrate-binding protein